MVTAWETEEAEAAPGVAERLAQLKRSINRRNGSGSDKQTEKRAAPSSAWKPGQSGNPNGRPPKPLCITSQVKVMLDEPAELPEDAPDFMKGWTRAQLVAYNMIVASYKPIPPVLKELLERVEGKVITPIEATGKDGMPIEVTIGARGKIADAVSRLVTRAGEN